MNNNDLMGCSPIVVHILLVIVGRLYQSYCGVCNGPTHCCCAIKPVTERSTLAVR